MSRKTALPGVIGIGNPLVDVIVMLQDEDLLRKFNLPRGSMTLVDELLSNSIYSETDSLKRELATGGSVANTMRTLSRMGGNCGYIGKIGKDMLGKLFVDEFNSCGVNDHLIYSNKDTGRVVSLVSRDSERTMATYLGAAADINLGDIDAEVFKPYQWLYLEGYLAYYHDFVRKIVAMAKEAGLKVAIDLASYNVVQVNLGFLKQLLPGNIDLVFANEEEAFALTGKEPEQALDEIAGICQTAVVKIGKKGSLVKSGEYTTRIGSIQARPLDSTGAGDNYAAGFFYGLTTGLGLEDCGKIAALIAGKAVENIGAKIPDNVWSEINPEIGKIVQKRP